MSIQVDVVGKAFPRRSSSFDIYRPQLVRFDDTTDGTVEHLDVVTTWRGISHEHAIELLFWEQAFQKSLESLIEGTLISDFMAIEHDAATGTLPEADTLFRLHQYVNSFGHKEFSFPLKSLVEFMLEYHETYGRHCTWFQSAGNIYSLVTNFLRTKDCFIQHPESHCTLEIYLSTSLQSIRCKEAYSGRPSLDSVSSVPGQILRITAEVLTSPHRLSYVMSADNKIGYLFEPPLLDQACNHVPQTIDVSSLTWQPRNVAVTVNRLFPGPVKFELAFRLKIEGQFDNTAGNQPLQQAAVPNFSEAKPLSTQSTCGRRESLFNDVRGLDGTSSSQVYGGSTQRPYHCPQRLRCDRHFFTDCVDAASESVSSLEDRSNRHIWTETACSQLERDAQNLYPRLYETYGDARIHKFSTLQHRKSFMDAESYPCRCPAHNLHCIPRHVCSWNRRHGNSEIMGWHHPRSMSPRRSDDSDLIPQCNRRMANRHAMFCSSSEDTFWESSLSHPKKDTPGDNDTAGVSSTTQPETPPNTNVSPSTPPQSDRAQEVISTSEKVNGIQEPSLEGNTPDAVFTHASDRFDGCREESRCRLDDSSSSAPAPVESGQQNAADPFRRGADSIKIPGKMVINEPFINAALVDTPQTGLPMRFKIRDLQKERQSNVNAKRGLHLHVDTSAKVNETYHCPIHSENCCCDTPSLNKSNSPDVSNHRQCVSSLTSPQWRAPRKTYRLQDRLANDRSNLTVRNFFDVLRSPDLSTTAASSPTCESYIDDAAGEMKLNSSKQECFATASRDQTTKNIHDDSVVEKGKRKRSAEEIGNTDINISSQVWITPDTSDNFELEGDWDKYGTLGLANSSAQSGTSDSHVSNFLDGGQPPSAMPKTPGSGPSQRSPASAPSSRRTRFAACTPTPTLRKRRAVRYDTPQKVDDTCTTQSRALADADAEQAQIQANFAEFLARAETMRPGRVIGAAQDPETSEFEAIFIESPMSVGTVDILVGETDEEETE